MEIITIVTNKDGSRLEKQVDDPDQVQPQTHWPFHVEVVSIDALLKKLEVPKIDYDTAVTLLQELSDAVERAAIEGNPDPIDLLKFQGKGNKARKAFCQGVRQLSPEERADCCLSQLAGARIVNDRAFAFDPNEDGKLLFEDTPLGWMQNALSAIWLEFNPPDLLVQHFFKPCSALTIEPCRIDGDREIHVTTVPALVYRKHDTVKAINGWVAGCYFRDIKDGYAQYHKQLEEYWREPVPNTSERNPVYRFIREPDDQLLKEAILFLQQVQAELVGDITQDQTKPPDNWFGPVITSKRMLAKALTGNPRWNALGRQFYTAENPDRPIWMRTDENEHASSHTFFFEDEQTFRKVEQFQTEQKARKKAEQEKKKNQRNER